MASFLWRPYLLLQPKVLLRLLGMNLHFDREILRNDRFWKAKLERDVLPPYHKRIVNYFRYYMLHNRKESGRLWEMTNRIHPELNDVSRIDAKRKWAINGDQLINLDNEAFPPVPAREIYGDRYIDLEDNLWRWMGRLIRSDVKELIDDDIYLTTRGEVFIGGDPVAKDIVQAVIME